MSISKSLRNSVDRVYAILGDRPQMFSGRAGDAEVYVMAIEYLLDELEGIGRTGRYATFLVSKGFGAKAFTATFEAGNSCRRAFVRYQMEDTVEMGGELEDRFASEFAAHWQEFLSWQKSEDAASPQMGDT